MIMSELLVALLLMVYYKCYAHNTLTINDIKVILVASSN